jgi:predicted flap endonuclease-1-like 5' DNA nuclease
VFAIFAVVSLVVAVAIGYLIGRAQRPRADPPAPVVAAALPEPPAARAMTPEPPAPPLPVADHAIAERARLIRSYEAEAAAARRGLRDRDAALTQLGDFAADRRRLFVDLADSRAETARYRELVVSLEDNAPPPLLGGPGTPDDLKLIVGVGPVMERMLYQLGVTTYRQIARWTERDIEEYDAKLPEFPGRIRRDGWVTQARALHQSKYGATLPLREHG